MSVSAYLIDGVHVRIRRTSNPKVGSDYLALAKREPFKLVGMQLVEEPGDVWFKFGNDPAVVVDEIVAEVKAAPVLSEAGA